MAEAGVEPPKAFRVIVADDTAGIRLLMRHILEGSGVFQVVGEATDGQEAVDLATRLQPDLVLLDLIMPRLDGLEAIPLIRQAAPAAKILILSGFSAQGLAVRPAAEGGPDGFIEKRQRPEDILQTALRVCRMGGRSPGQPPPSPPAVEPGLTGGTPDADVPGPRPGELVMQIHGPSADSLDALERARADLAQIGSAAAHDLKSPLQAALGFAHLLEQLYGSSLDDRAQMFVRTIVESTERMATLVDGLGAYCSAVSARPEHRPAPLAQVLDEVVGSLQPEVASSGAHLTLPPLPQVVEDPDRVGMVLTQLLTNAIRWGRPPEGGPPCVTVAAEETSSGWTVSVQDTGAGIPPDQRRRLFGLFRPSAGSGPRGAGTGLAIAKRLVESWGGGIWMEDVAGGGSRFCFTLPWPGTVGRSWFAGAEPGAEEVADAPMQANLEGQLAVDSALAELAVREALGPAPAATAGPATRLLLVEDSEPHARLVAATLEEAPGPPYVLRHVPDLRQAQMVLGTDEVDCVLLDLSLPDGEGLGSLAAVRSMRPSTPVVVLTSRADESLAVAAVQQGAQDYLVKGALDPRALGRSIRYAIERKALEAQLARQALHDSLTGLPNRTLLLDRLGPALTRADRTNEKLALLYLDLDGFKPINDALGHEAGDWILKEVARRLLSIVRPHDTVARIGGDEFAVLCEGFHAESEIQSLADRMAERIADPVTVGNQHPRVQASIGIAFVAGHGESVEDLMRQADRAMYANKRHKQETPPAVRG